ncbi:hypothetical protein LCGC14_2539260, partial [marine sediment metagenome]
RHEYDSQARPYSLGERLTIQVRYEEATRQQTEETQAREIEEEIGIVVTALVRRVSSPTIEGVPVCAGPASFGNSSGRFRVCLISPKRVIETRWTSALPRSF